MSEREFPEETPGETPGEKKKTYGHHAGEFESEFLAARFESHRARLSAVAYRMLGSRAEADDAVQEAWIKISRADTSDVENLGGWLTTVVGRVCLDMLGLRT